MAIYHLSLKAIQRSKGRSSTASAAYRSRARIFDERTGQTYDYTRKKGVEARAVYTPDGSQISRSALWNMAEAAEHRKDGITAREYELALPSELDQERRQELARNFCKFLMERYGVAVDMALHAPTPDGDQRNYHAHILITTRRYSAGQLLEKTDFDLSGSELKKKGLKPQKEQLEEIREEWERLANKALEESGSRERISHKSHEELGIKVVPTVHMGVAATAMERKGIATDRGELNRRPVLRRLYGEFIQVRKEIRKLDAELAEIRQKREAEENDRVQRIANDNQDKRQPERGREPGSSTPTVQASTTQKAARSGFAASAANGGSKKPVQPDQVTAGRAEEPEKYPGRTGESHRSPAGRPEIARGGFKPDSQGTERVFTERPPRGFRSGPDSGRGDIGDRGSDRGNLESSGEAGSPHWLHQLEAIKQELIERIIEYRTIGDLLAMRDGIEPALEEREKRTPQGPR